MCFLERNHFEAALRQQSSGSAAGRAAPDDRYVACLDRQSIDLGNIHHGLIVTHADGLDAADQSTLNRKKRAQ